MTMACGVFICVALVPASLAFADPTDCSIGDTRTGACVNATVDGGTVTLSDSSTKPGTNVPQIPTVNDGVFAAPPKPVGSHDLPPGYRDGYGVTGPLTLSDLASFTPTAGTDHMQPNGWAVIGVSTNFYAEVSTQVQDGTLLGEPASVRFTPKAFHWNYGDGTVVTRSTKGGTWAAQGITDFDPTATSHVYRAKGDYTITLTIDFGAEYRYAGGDWIAVAGTLAVPANPLSTTAGDAKTVLVSKDCLANPSGPGC
ncbi:MAG: uncharacterized protein JWN80_2658 [Microbacteriaceae bacterium]|jgi:hypothetical protein|nr:uncharacterized protein [Microbacteriaceae bacterium]